MRRSHVVLWGAHRGDVQYASRDFWRLNIPIDPSVGRVAVASAAYFDVGDLVTGQRLAAMDAYRVAGKEGDVLGLSQSYGR